MPEFVRRICLNDGVTEQPIKSILQTSNRPITNRQTVDLATSRRCITTAHSVRGKKGNCLRGLERGVFIWNRYCGYPTTHVCILKSRSTVVLGTITIVNFLAITMIMNMVYMIEIPYLTSSTKQVIANPVISLPSWQNLLIAKLVIFLWSWFCERLPLSSVTYVD